MAERMESPLGSGLNRSGSSPPSPVLDLAPMRFMAMASVVCASREMEPNDMAPVAKRFTISLARLDLRDVDGRLADLGRVLDAEQRADGEQVLRRIHHLGEGAVAILRISAHRMLEQRDAVRRPGMGFAADAIGIFPPTSSASL